MTASAPAPYTCQLHGVDTLEVSYSDSVLGRAAPPELDNLLARCHGFSPTMYPLKTGFPTCKPKSPATAWGIGNALWKTPMSKRASDTPPYKRKPPVRSPIRAAAVTGDALLSASLRIGDTAQPSKRPPAPIRVTPPLNDNIAPPAAPRALIREEPIHQGVRKQCRAADTSKGVTCDNPAQKPHQGIRILTNLPDKIPVLPGEIALLETYWGAILDLMAANDNDAE